MPLFRETRKHFWDRKAMYHAKLAYECRKRLLATIPLSNKSKLFDREISHT
jgi:hypothetical protein